MHKLTAETGKFEDDAASTFCVYVSGWGPVYMGHYSVISSFFRKVDSTCGPEGGGERMERWSVCLFNRELVSQPDPILRTWAGMWVGSVCFHPVLAFRFHCFGAMSLSVKTVVCGGYTLYFTIRSNIFSNSLRVFVSACAHTYSMSMWACVVSVLGGICWQRPRGWHPAVGTGQGPKAVIKARKRKGTTHIQKQTVPHLSLLY